VEKLFMERRAADNEYLHRDFHGALSTAIEYLDSTSGEASVREYLRRFASTYYAPLREAIRSEGLAPLREWIEAVYMREGGEVKASLSDDGMRVDVVRCPAVSHMRERGYAVARLFGQTTRVVYEAICESTPYACRMVSYDDASGQSVCEFTRRPA
jgi:hypothetical protein